MAAIGGLLGQPSVFANHLRTARHLDGAAGDHSHGDDIEADEKRGSIRYSDENVGAARARRIGVEEGLYQRARRKRECVSRGTEVPRSNIQHPTSNIRRSSKNQEPRTKNQAPGKRRGKFQASTSNIQRRSNPPTSKKTRGSEREDWSLMFGVSLDVGC